LAYRPQQPYTDLAMEELPSIHPALPATGDLQNTALKLTTEWGENYGEPINERMLAVFPDLTGEDIAALTELAREVEYYIYSLAESELRGEINERDIVPLAMERYAWLSRENAQRLCGIGMFYARK
jgi:hypothetical protein